MNQYYHIVDLEKLSGIKAHTIRIWEKRYQLIEPHRTETNIRQYDDMQLKKLLNVASLLNNGYKISEVAKLSLTELRQEVLKISDYTKDNNEHIINDLTLAMMQYDEVGFDKCISTAVLKFGLLDTMLHIIYPFLNKVGLMWSIDNTMPAQEHFTSHLIKQKLLSAIDSLPHATSKELYLLFLPENEFHEIGLLLSHYILRTKGIRTIYLGQNVPIANIEASIKQIQPTHLLTMIISNLSADFFNYRKFFLFAKKKKIPLLMAGKEPLIEPFLSTHPFTLLKSPKDL